MASNYYIKKSNLPSWAYATTSDVSLDTICLTPSNDTCKNTTFKTLYSDGGTALTDLYIANATMSNGVDVFSFPCSESNHVISSFRPLRFILKGGMPIISNSTTPVTFELDNKNSEGDVLHLIIWRPTNTTIKVRKFIKQATYKGAYSDTTLSDTKKEYNIHIAEQYWDVDAGGGVWNDFYPGSVGINQCALPYTDITYTFTNGAPDRVYFELAAGGGGGGGSSGSHGSGGGGSASTTCGILTFSEWASYFQISLCGSGSGGLGGSQSTCRDGGAGGRAQLFARTDTVETSREWQDSNGNIFNTNYVFDFKGICTYGGKGGKSGTNKDCAGGAGGSLPVPLYGSFYYGNEGYRLNYKQTTMPSTPGWLSFSIEDDDYEVYYWFLSDESLVLLDWDTGRTGGGEESDGTNCTSLQPTLLYNNVTNTGYTLHSGVTFTGGGHEGESGGGAASALGQGSQSSGQDHGPGGGGTGRNSTRSDGEAGHPSCLKLYFEGGYTIS